MKTLILGVFLLVLILILCGSLLAFEHYHAERIYPGVWVWGIDVSGLNLDEAATNLQNNLELDSIRVTLRGPDRSWGIRPTDLGIQLHSEATLAPAYTLGREGAWSDNLSTRVQLLIEGENLRWADEGEVEGIEEEHHIPPAVFLE